MNEPGRFWSGPDVGGAVRELVIDATPRPLRGHEAHCVVAERAGGPTHGASVREIAELAGV